MLNKILWVWLSTFDWRVSQITVGAQLKTNRDISLNYIHWSMVERIRSMEATITADNNTNSRRFILCVLSLRLSDGECNINHIESGVFNIIVENRGATTCYSLVAWCHRPVPTRYGWKHTHTKNGQVLFPLTNSNLMHLHSFQRANIVTMACDYRAQNKYDEWYNSGEWMVCNGKIRMFVSLTAIGTKIVYCGFLSFHKCSFHKLTSIAR